MIVELRALTSHFPTCVSSSQAIDVPIMRSFVPLSKTNVRTIRFKQDISNLTKPLTSEKMC